MNFTLRYLVIRLINPNLNLVIVFKALYKHLNFYSINLEILLNVSLAAIDQYAIITTDSTIINSTITNLFTKLINASYCYPNNHAKFKASFT